MNQLEFTYQELQEMALVVKWFGFLLPASWCDQVRKANKRMEGKQRRAEKRCS